MRQVLTAVTQTEKDLEAVRLQIMHDHTVWMENEKTVAGRKRNQEAVRKAKIEIASRPKSLK